MTIVRSVIVLLLLSSSTLADDRPCAHRYQLSVDDPEPQYTSWSYSVGTKLYGHANLPFEGDGTSDDCTATAEIQRDYAVNPETGVRSKDRYCWFSVELNVRAPGGRLLYSDGWSIKFDDLGPLLETHGAKNPEAYFSGFFGHAAYFTNGLAVSPPKDLLIQTAAIESSLRVQGVTAEVPTIASELKSLESVRTFVYRGDWKEDLRVVAYVPSLKRGALIRRGY